MFSTARKKRAVGGVGGAEGAAPPTLCCWMTCCLESARDLWISRGMGVLLHAATAMLLHTRRLCCDAVGVGDACVGPAGLAPRSASAHSPLG